VLFHMQPPIRREPLRPAAASHQPQP
jgi:hypothetical protein